MHSKLSEQNFRDLSRFKSWLRSSVDPQETTLWDHDLRNLSGPKSLQDSDVHEALYRLHHTMALIGRLPQIPPEDGGTLSDIVWPHGRADNLRGFSITADGLFRVAKIKLSKDHGDPAPDIRAIRYRKPNTLDIRKFVEMGGRAENISGLISQTIINRLDEAPFTILRIDFEGNSDTYTVVAAMTFEGKKHIMEMESDLLLNVIPESELAAGAIIPARAWSVTKQLNIAVGDPISMFLTKPL